MADTNIEILAILRHYFKMGHKATVAARKIREVEGDEKISDRTAQKWYKRFKDGDLSLERKPRSGRPPVVNLQDLKQTVETNPTTSTRKLSEELGPSKDTICRALHKLQKTYKTYREVPHELTPQQAHQRVEICKTLRENPLDMRFFKRIVTCDEKWVYLRNPDTRKQWLDVGQAAEPVAKQGRFENKFMICVWWNFEQVIHFEIIPQGRAVNSDLYCAQLDRMYAALKRKYPALVNRGRALLQQDNARPHTSRMTRAKIEELDGIELLPHPAYSPDLAPSDFHMFRSMASFFRGRRFANVEELERGCVDFFASKSKDWYRHGILQLAQRWHETIAHDGLYFDV